MLLFPFMSIHVHFSPSTGVVVSVAHALACATDTTTPVDGNEWTEVDNSIKLLLCHPSHLKLNKNRKGKMGS